jgi:hypothetical protein
MPGFENRPEKSCRLLAPEKSGLFFIAIELVPA